MRLEKSTKKIKISKYISHFKSKNTDVKNEFNHGSQKIIKPALVISPSESRPAQLRPCFLEPIAFFEIENPSDAMR